MSEENNGVSNTPATDVSDVDQETQTTTVSDGGHQAVQYHTHKKLLGQHKNTVQELETAREKLAQLEAEKLEAEGDKDKMIESLKGRLQETTAKLKGTVGSIAEKNAMSAIVEEAVKMGCNSPNVVKKFLKDEIQTLSFTEDFEPDRDQVIELVAKAKTESPMLFGKDAPKTANHNVSAGGTSDPNRNLKTMKMDDLFKTLGESL